MDCVAASSVRLAAVADAQIAAQLLHDFNTEFDTPSPGVAALAERLSALLERPTMFAVLGGEPAVGLALVTLRTNVWYAGAVGLLDELYVAPSRRGQGLGSALVDRVLSECRERSVELLEVNVDEPDVDAMRFYMRHGFLITDPDSHQRAFYLSRSLG